MWYPSTQGVLAAAVRERVAQSLARVLEKYRISGADVAGAYAPELSLAIALGSVAVPLYRAIAADRAAAKQPAAVAPAGPTQRGPEKPTENPMQSFAHAFPAG